MSDLVNCQNNQQYLTLHVCTVCGSKAFGMNFGVLTCAPCKAFFRRNARRKDILDLPCQHHDINANQISTENHETIDYTSQMRRCSTCRLRRCYDMGMKEELIRTEEENIRYRQLVELNRRKREFLKQKQKQNMTLPQSIENNKILRESDWCHLSNIVAAYETHCLKTFTQQRLTFYSNEPILLQHQAVPLKHYTILPMSLTASLCSFFHSLPAFHSLSRINRVYLCKNNLRSLLFPNLYELSQSCFSEQWQLTRDKTTWALICGTELYEQFVHTEKLADRLLIADPIITRVWMVALFFSSSLFCYYDAYQLYKHPKKKSVIIEIQNIYAALLWKYLLHRYDFVGAVKIYSNFINMYLRMQRVGFEIGVQVRTRSELLVTYEMLNKILTLNIRDC